MLIRLRAVFNIVPGNGIATVAASQPPVIPQITTGVFARRINKSNFFKGADFSSGVRVLPEIGQGRHACHTDHRLERAQRQARLIGIATERVSNNARNTCTNESL